MNDNDLAHRILGLIKTKNAAFWEKERRARSLDLFHRAARGVPAYKDFLRKHKVEPGKIKTFEDFTFVPPVSKAEYLKAYPLEDLVWGGTLKKPIVFTSTSGSTGAPFYFPRERRLDWESSILHEIFLKNGSRKNNGSTLVIIGFGMGAWIGGLITYKAFEIANEREMNVSIITPGINKGEIFHALKNLAPQFDQTIFAGYPPFVKDILDEAPGYGINLKRLNMRLLFAAEAFSETFRNYVAKAVGIKNVYLDTLNVYGTADIGTMAYETPMSILIRRMALGNKKIFDALFSDSHRTPTLAQYNPLFTTFEGQGNNVLLTGDNTIPLIRYAIGDRGGVLNFRQIADELSFLKVNFKKEAKKAGIERTVTQLPFVYVYERSDLSTKLYGAIIYPEPIKEALQGAKFHKLLTGKFTMATRFDARQNQYLEINVELKPNILPSKHIASLSSRMIVARLLAKSAEYRNNYNSIPHKVVPRIKLWPYGHHKYFRGGGKQRWVEKAEIKK